MTANIPSDFQKALAEWLQTPASRIGQGRGLVAEPIETPLGTMVAVAGHDRLHLLEFADRKNLGTELIKLSRQFPDGLGLGRALLIERLRHQLDCYFALRSGIFEIPLAMHGTAFSQTVWRALLAIPLGQTRSYAGLAIDIGRPSAVRAVARANSMNQIAILVPCHRVLGSDGSLTGYAGGLERKRQLLQIEQALSAKAENG